MLLGNRSVSRGRKASSPEFSSEAFNMIVCPDPSAKYSFWLKTNNKHRWSYNQNQTFSTVEMLLISFLVLTCRFLQFDLRSPKCEVEYNQQLWHLLITTAYSTHLFSTQKCANTFDILFLSRIFRLFPCCCCFLSFTHSSLQCVCVRERSYCGSTRWADSCMFVEQFTREQERAKRVWEKEKKQRVSGSRENK